MSGVLASYLVKVVVRADGDVSALKIVEIEDAIAEAVNDKFGEASVEVSVNAERTDQ